MITSKKIIAWHGSDIYGHYCVDEEINRPKQTP
jgi:hypothetical protein